MNARIEAKIAGDAPSGTVLQLPEPWYNSALGFMFRAVVVLGGIYGILRLLGSRIRQGIVSVRGDSGDADDEVGAGERSKKNTTGFETPDETLKDVGGSFAAVDRLTMLAGDIERYRAGQWADLPKGILMSGFEGTGKTHSARCFAGQIKCPFIARSSSELTSSPYIGSWGKKVDKLYASAREFVKAETKRLRQKKGATGQENGVVVIFVDEFSSLGSSRKGGGDHPEKVRVVDALLEQMDSINREKNKGIILVAATNFVEGLDSALLRPGRFREQIPFTIPSSIQEREDVLLKASKRILKETELTGFTKDLRQQIAALTPGFSQDMLRDVVAEAARTIKRADAQTITLSSLIEALLVVTAGPHSDRAPEPRRVELTMAHEHGHGLISEIIGHSPIVVSARPRAKALGIVLTPAAAILEGGATRDDILRAMLLFAAGRAGEIVFGGVGAASDGVGSDFQQLHTLARNFMRDGMSDGLSPRLVGDRKDSNDSRVNPEVEKLAKRTISAAVSILEAFGKESFQGLVRESVAAKQELVGPEAGKLYRGALRGNRELVNQRLAQFIAEPLGKE